MRKCPGSVSDGRDRTLEEVAEILGISKQAVKQIEDRALAKLRVRLKALGVQHLDVVSNTSDTSLTFRVGGVKHPYE